MSQRRLACELTAYQMSSGCASVNHVCCRTFEHACAVSMANTTVRRAVRAIKKWSAGSMAAPASGICGEG